MYDDTEEPPSTRAARQGLACMLLIVLLLFGPPIYLLYPLTQVVETPHTGEGAITPADAWHLIKVFGIVCCAALIGLVAACGPPRRQHWQ